MVSVKKFFHTYKEIPQRKISSSAKSILFYMTKVCCFYCLRPDYSVFVQLKNICVLFLSLAAGVLH